MFNIDKERIMKEIVKNKNIHVFKRDIIEYDFNLLYENDRDKKSLKELSKKLLYTI